MKLSKLNLYFISLGLGFVYFWIALAIPYLMYRSLSSVEVFSLMSIYQLFGVFLEYPTGVIGDRFGYRKVLFIANTLNALSMVILAQVGNYWYYLFGLFILALGTGFSSGNDQGLLKAVSPNIRRDTANRTALAETVIFLSAIIGSWLGDISYELALYISAALMFCANIPLLFLSDDKQKETQVSTVKQIVSDGIKSLSQPIFSKIFIILAVFGGLFFSTKSIVGSFNELYGFDLKIIGIIVGLSALSRAIGSKIYAYNQSISKFAVMLFITFSIISLSIAPISYVVLIIIIFHFAVGYILSAIDGDIHELASDHIRSSLFSLKRLIMRLFSSLYLYIYGLFIHQNLFNLLMLILGITMLFITIATRTYTMNNQKINSKNKRR